MNTRITGLLLSFMVTGNSSAYALVQQFIFALPMQVDSTFFEASMKKIIVGLFCLLCLAIQSFSQINNARPLSPDHIFEREITGGDTHSYEIDLKKDEFFQVRVDQKGIDVSLKLLDPNSKEIALIDSLEGDKGLELLSAAAESDGKYILQVVASGEKTSKAVYTIKRLAPRMATSEDREAILVEKEEQNKRNQIGKLLEEIPKLIGEISPTTSSEIFQSSLSKTANGLKIAQSLKSVEGETVFLFFTARMFEEKGEFQRSVDYYKNTLEVIRSEESKRTELKTMEVTSLKKMGRVYDNNLSNSEEAARSYFQALSLYKEDEEDEDKGILLRYFGDVLMEYRFYPQAEENYVKAIKVFRNLQLKFELGATIGKLGRVYFNQENKAAEALKNLLESDKLLENSPDGSDYQETRLYNLGYISLLYERINDKGNARLYREKVRKLEDKTKEPFVVFVNKILFGDILYEKGDYKESLVIYQEALDYAVKSFKEEVILSQTLALKKIMRVYVTMKKTDGAVITFLKATKLLETLEDHTALALFHEDFADLCDDELGAGVYSKAINILMSEEKRPKQVNFEEVVRIQNKWAKAQLANNNINGALVNFRTSLLVQMSLYQQIALADMLADRMIAFTKLNKKRLAIFFGKQAIALKQETRRTIKSFPVATQKAFLKQNRDVFEKLIGLLIEEKRLHEAIQIINLFQDQEFFDFDNDPVSNKTIFYTSHEKAALIEIQKLRGSLINSREKFLSNPDFDKLGNLIERLETDFAEPSNENDRSLQIEEVEEIEKMLADLETSTKQNTVVAYTLIGEEVFHLLLVSKTGIEHFSTPVNGNTLNENIKEFARNIQIVDHKTLKPKIDVTPQAKKLYDVVFKPLENRLPKGVPTTIMWNLDGNLRYLPINALHDEKDYLIRRNLNNVVFTRSDTKQILTPPKSTWKVSGFVNTEEKKKVINNEEYYYFPALNAGKQEVEGIVKNKNVKTGLLDGDVFLNSEFTRQSMLSELKKQNPVIHISSHFKMQPGDLTRSFLVLGDGTAFSLFEMSQEAQRSFPEGKLFAGVDLLTLSACDTGSSESDSDGREIDSFAELAQRFGAASVIATLWSVNECSTAEFMKLFYKNKVDGMMNKADAIRQAQLALLDGKVQSTAAVCWKKGEDKKRDEPVLPTSTKNYPVYKENPAKPFAHPYYWSPFILYGNWK